MIAYVDEAPPGPNSHRHEFARSRGDMYWRCRCGAYVRHLEDSRGRPIPTPEQMSVA